MKKLRAIIKNLRAINKQKINNLISSQFKGELV